MLATEGATELRSVLNDDGVRDEARRTLDALRSELASGAAHPDRGALLAEASARLARVASKLRARKLRRVINGTGVVLHTNLGRAPLAAGVLDDVRDACEGYSALEYDLERGARGHRDRVVKDLLVRITGAEDAIVVNNCAAAVLLACTAFASGREVIVSRGELVEIGGGFRVPDVIASCGATLVEVGTTNKTRAEDYARAMSERTGALLAVHQSNFAVLGFTQRAPREALAELAAARGVPLLEDLGSGALVDLSEWGLGAEPSVQDAVSGGSDVVMFSGDKLLGGPQAGILVGRARWIEPLRQHPLMRALRPGRVVFAALEATLARYASGRAAEELPALRALREALTSVRARAESLLRALEADGANDGRWSLDVLPSEARVGGGTLPLARIPSYALCVRSPREPAAIVALERALRAGGEPPVVARVQGQALWVDLRTVAPDELSLLATALARALRGSHYDGASDQQEAPLGSGSDPDDA